MDRTDIPGVPLVSPSGIHAAWISIEKYPHRRWFDVVFSGIKEFTFLRLGDVVIFVMDDGRQVRFPFLHHHSGMVIIQNAINVKEDDLAGLVATGISRIGLCRISTMQQRTFVFSCDDNMIFRQMVLQIYEESKALGW